MISPRQRPRLTPEVPVLFSLPNLRTRGSNPAVVPADEPAPGTGSLRIDVPAPLRVDVPIPPRSEAPATSRSESPAPHTIPLDQKMAAERSSSTSAPIAVVNQSPRRINGRSWMERVGSRLILVVTLMVIVTAAWITGRQIPSSKPDPWDHAGVHSGQVQSDTAARRDDPAPSSTPPSDTQAGAAAISKGTQPKASAVVVSPARTAARKPHIESSVAATLPADDSTSIFNAVSLQSPAASQKAASEAEQNESLPLAAPLTATPPEDTSPQPDEILDTLTLDSASGEPSTPGPQTSTPNAPVIDPDVLLPWLNQQSPARHHRTSATPNAITDWSKYLPSSSSSQQTVRAVSSTEPADFQSPAQQAVMPPGVVNNPYSQ